MLKSATVFALALLASAPALANDSTAEIKTGGLVLTRTDAISMDGEQLFISLDEIQVAYRFRNRTEEDVDTIVAFPMPDIQYNPYGDTALPDLKSDNFLGFSATVEGQPVAVQLEQRAFAGTLDVTDALKAAGVPLFPFGEAAFDALKALPPETLQDWQSRGIVFNDRYDVGKGMQDHPTPYWVLKSTYWWRMTFPAGRSIMVEHRYAPSVGATVGVNFFMDGRFAGPTYEDYRQRYCLDKDFESAVRKAMARRGRRLSALLRKSHLVCAHHRQQLGRLDRLVQCHCRQGQSGQSGQLLRHQCPQDRADHVRNDDEGLLPDTRIRRAHPQADGKLSDGRWPPPRGGHSSPG